ncbi:MAG: 6-pyruvoyl-tetrahydropterin synthase-related protein [Desulfobacteraceae bacterium]|jgi:hypothetical protein
MTEKKGWLGERPLLHDTILIILLSLPFISPLFNFHWIMVGESIEQILRLIELDRGIREGILYPRWFGDLAGGFGYPYLIFYAPLVYYVSEMFHLLGFGLLTSLKWMIYLGVLLSGIGMFLLARAFWGRYGALVSAVAYIYVPYRMVNLYIRGDFSEAFAMAFPPLILYFFYRMLRDKRSQYMAGAVLSYAALILTHNCTALIFSGFLLLFLAFISIQNKNWEGFLRGVLAIIWALGISAIFWLPALVEKKWVNIHLIYSDASLDFHNNFIELFRLLLPTWTFEGGSGGRDLPFQMGWPHILLAFFSSLYVMKLEDSTRKDMRQLVLFFLLCTLLAVFLTNGSSILLWENLPLMKYLQFPWRFLTVLSLFVSFVSGGLFSYFAGTPRLTQKMFQTVLVIIIILSSIQYCRVKGYYILREEQLTPAFVKEDGGTISACNTNEMDKITDFGEYMPKSVKKLPDKMRAGTVFINKGKARIAAEKAGIQNYEFKIFAQEKTEVIVGSFYYPSWDGRMDGQPIDLFTDAEGLIHLEVPEGLHEIKVFFGETKVRKIVKYLSFIALLALFASLLVRRFTVLRSKSSR